MIWHELFRPEAEGRREVYPPVLMYFLFGACVRTLRQLAQHYVLFLASMCFRIYHFVSFPIVFAMPNGPQASWTRERNEFAVARLVLSHAHFRAPSPERRPTGSAEPLAESWLLMCSIVSRAIFV
jgi:hypothetical protein